MNFEAHLKVALARGLVTLKLQIMLPSLLVSMLESRQLLVRIASQVRKTKRANPSLSIESHPGGQSAQLPGGFEHRVLGDRKAPV